MYDTHWSVHTFTRPHTHILLLPPCNGLFCGRKWPYVFQEDSSCCSLSVWLKMHCRFGDVFPGIKLRIGQIFCFCLNWENVYFCGISAAETLYLLPIRAFFYVSSAWFACEVLGLWGLGGQLCTLGNLKSGKRQSSLVLFCVACNLSHYSNENDIYDCSLLWTFKRQL